MFFYNEINNLYNIKGNNNKIIVIKQDYTEYELDLKTEQIVNSDMSLEDKAKAITIREKCMKNQLFVIFAVFIPFSSILTGIYPILSRKISVFCDCVN